MGDMDTGLGGHEAARNRAVDIAHDDHDVGGQLVDHRLEALHDPRCLCCVASRADIEIDVGGPDGELVEEDVAHGGVVVLASMHNDVLVALRALGVEAPIIALTGMDRDAEVETIKTMLTDLGRPELGEDLATRIRTEVRDIMADGAKAAQSGDFDGAVRHMMQAVQKLPGNTHVLFNASLALLKHIENLGWNDRFAANARDFIERVRRQDPANPRLGAMVTYLHTQMKKYNVRADQF